MQPSVFDRLLVEPEHLERQSNDANAVETLYTELRALQRDLEVLLSTPSKAWLNPRGIVGYQSRWQTSTLHLSSDRSLPVNVSASTYNYGIPSLVGRTLDLLNLDELCVAIIHAIAAFEPRIDADSLRVTRRDAGAMDSLAPHIIGIELSCSLIGQPDFPAIVVHAEVNVETGTTSVHVTPEAA